MESNEGNVIDGNQIGQTIQTRQTVAFVGSTELTGCHMMNRLKFNWLSC
jgi:hypothetical protein